MKIWEKLILWLTWLAGYGLMFFLSIWSIYKGLIVGQAQTVKYNLIIGSILLVIGLIFSGWIMKLYNRKLQAIATVEEMGQKPVTNFIITRILKLLEILFPLAALTFLFKGITDVNITIPANIIMRNIIIWVVSGFIILLVHDFLRNLFLNRKVLREAIKLEDRINKQRNKRKHKIKHIRR